MENLKKEVNSQSIKQRSCDLHKTVTKNYKIFVAVLIFAEIDSNIEKWRKKRSFLGGTEMKSGYRRLLCFLLVLIMLPLCLFEAAVPAQAAYENTHVNTGDQRYDIIEVAKTQLGYREVGGKTKYGEWYGHPYVDWCAVFIGWCAEQAGIPKTIIKKQGWANPTSFGWKSYPATVRVPQPGDVFFRDTAHTGLVYYVEGNYFYTLEGNTWGEGDSTPRVMIRKRELYNSTYTFSSPEYEGESGLGGNNGCDHEYQKGNDSFHPHKEYQKCKLCGYSYYTGITISLTSCQECKMENCSHSYGSWSKLDNTYHKTNCSLCGKENKQSHHWGNDKVLREPTCKDKGKKSQQCNECGATREVDIPATNRHEYTDWRYIDDTVHAQKCKTCDERTEKKHKVGDWTGDTRTHWKTCNDCGARISIGNHQLEEGCDSVCTICGIDPNITHKYNATWKEDEVKHWQQCLDCAEIRLEAEHQFTADCDDTCDECGYYREVSHIYGKQWNSDITGHWLSCQICGQEKDKKPHTSGAAATETSSELCTQCAYEITPVLLHTHEYTYTNNERSHLGTCRCGEDTGAVRHIWDIQADTCQTCQSAVPLEPREMLFGVLEMPNVTDDPLVWKIVSISVASLLALIILALLAYSIIQSIRIAAAKKLAEELEEEDEEDSKQFEPEDWPAAAMDEEILETEEPVPIADSPDIFTELDDTEALLRAVAEFEDLADVPLEEVGQVDIPEEIAEPEVSVEAETPAEAEEAAQQEEEPVPV